MRRCFTHDVLFCVFPYHDDDRYADHAHGQRRSEIRRCSHFFIHLLMIYLMSLPDYEFDDNAQLQAVRDIKAAALFRNEDIRKRAQFILNKIQAMISKHFSEYNSVIEYQLEKTKPGKSYAEIISERFGGAYMEKGLKLAKQYQRSVGYV